MFHYATNLLEMAVCYAKPPYLLKNGMQARREDLVDAFEPAEFEQVGTVAEQQAAYEEWLRSLG